MPASNFWSWLMHNISANFITVGSQQVIFVFTFLYADTMHHLLSCSKIHHSEVELYFNSKKKSGKMLMQCN